MTRRRLRAAGRPPSGRPAAGRAPGVLLRSDAGGVAVLTLNRPERYNALSAALLASLHAELDAIARDAAVRVVVIAGRGRAFCAWHDLGELGRGADRGAVARLFETCTALMLKIVRLPQPISPRSAASPRRRAASWWPSAT